MRRTPAFIVVAIGVVLASLSDSARQLVDLADAVIEFAPLVGWQRAYSMAVRSDGIELCHDLSASSEKNAPEKNLPARDMSDHGRFTIGMPSASEDALDAPRSERKRAERDGPDFRSFKDRPALPPPRKAAA